MGDLGDRMKGYEQTFSHRLVKRTPLVIRVDGRAFHTVTRGCEKPFDHQLMGAMDAAARTTAEEIQGCKIAYVQSDEVTFVLSDFDELTTQGWFDYKLSKVVSIAAATMSVAFNQHIKSTDCARSISEKLVVFDARAFSVPPDEVTNVLLWRALDWRRNSVQMYAMSVFSHKEMHRKGQSALHDMLHQKGLNWAEDLTGREKNGCFILKDKDGRWVMKTDVRPSYQDIYETLPYPLRKE